MLPRLSAAEARRIAVAAQGLAEPRPTGRLDRRHLDRVLGRIGVLQIDSVNVLARAHYLPLLARLGPYPTALLDDPAWTARPRRLFEYWGHQASLLPVETQPLLRWRMARAEQGDGIYGGLARFGRERRPFIDSVLAEVAQRGPVTAADFEDGRGKGSWWGWSDAKRALEWLFWAGRITTAGRRNGFARTYDLPERVLPPGILGTATPSEPDARRALIAIAARALGIATTADLADYFRFTQGETRPRIAELVESGDLLPVSVEGWNDPAYLDPAARRPRRVTTAALLCPFDPLIWDRDRTERMFGFRYRIGIYTPADQREHGYYVLPFLLGDRLVARLDLKADRAAGRLLAPGVHLEPGNDPDTIAEPLALELGAMARWLSLGTIEITGAGPLGDRLRRLIG